MRKISALPLLLFAVLLLHGTLLGLTDDEAYYWVLAQRPAWGYAYHPPMVAWSIAFFQKALGWLFGDASPGLVRLPAAFFSASIAAMGGYWARQLAGPAARSWRAELAIVSFAGVFASSWMMVPDLPLLFGWMLVFVGTWRLCESQGEKAPVAMIGFGVAMAILSKFSGVLAVVSSALALAFWAPLRTRRLGFAALAAGLALALIPIIAWNAAHDWGPLLYQFRDRHTGADYSFKRYGQFWGTQLLLAGPPLLLFSFLSIRRLIRERSRVSKYVAVWAAPAVLAFCFQPFWASFKPHWALVVWLPFALELAWRFARGQSVGIARAQAVYGLCFGALALVMCHFPIVPAISERLTGGKAFDPRWDVTNDMYGWDELPRFLAAHDQPDARLAVVGSRYQTASQAAFVLGDPSRVTLLPRGAKELEEWPNLEVTDHQGPGWPALATPVYFVADNRYDEGPKFESAKCEVLGAFEKTRQERLAKRVTVWRCNPLRIE